MGFNVTNQGPNTVAGCFQTRPEGRFFDAKKNWLVDLEALDSTKSSGITQPLPWTLQNVPTGW